MKNKNNSSHDTAAIFWSITILIIVFHNDPDIVDSISEALQGLAFYLRSLAVVIGR